MIGEIRQNFTEASASVGLILATALNYSNYTNYSNFTNYTKLQYLHTLHQLKLFGQHAQENIWAKPVFKDVSVFFS